MVKQASESKSQTQYPKLKNCNDPVVIQQWESILRAYEQARHGYEYQPKRQYLTRIARPKLRKFYFYQGVNENRITNPIPTSTTRGAFGIGAWYIGSGVALLIAWIIATIQHNDR